MKHGFSDLLRCNNMRKIDALLQSSLECTLCWEACTLDTSKVGLKYLEANVTIGTQAYNIDICSILIKKYFGNVSDWGPMQLREVRLTSTSKWHAKPTLVAYILCT